MPTGHGGYIPYLTFQRLTRFVNHGYVQFSKPARFISKLSDVQGSVRYRHGITVPYSG